MDAPLITPRLRVLHAIHDFLPRHRAGSEIYAAELCRELASRHHVTVLCADYDPSRVHGQLTWRVYDGLPVVEIANNWVCTTFEDTYRSPEISSRLEDVLAIVQPHVVHVHNLLNLSFDLPATARARGIPVVATLHDYTLVCPSGGQRIHRADSHLCRTIDESRCMQCFSESPFYTLAAVGSVASAVPSSGLVQRIVSTARQRAPGLVRAAATTMTATRGLRVTEADIHARLAAARHVFDQVDLFVAPSRSIADEFMALGLSPSKVRVSDYGFRGLPRPVRGDARLPLRIGFVGTLVWHKGVHVLIDAVRQLPVDMYELHIHGDANMFPEYTADLRQRAAGLPVRFMGRFDASKTSAAYSDMDVLVVPSLWLENSPLVIHEAFQCGVPVVGSNIGGISDLLADGRGGCLFYAGSADNLAAVLRSLIDNPARVTGWAAQLPDVKSIADEAREWERTYAEVTSPARVPAAAAG